jgi:ketosteroid isomerase-like protein
LKRDGLYRCTVQEASDQGDTVVVTPRFKGKNKSGAELDTQAEHVWEVRDGKIARMENKSTRRPGLRGWS